MVAGTLPLARWLCSYLGAPIRIKGKTVGFLNLESSRPGFFGPVHMDRLKAFANDAAIAIENARLHAEVQRLTIIDELTQIYNYRGLHDLGQREIERAIRFKRPLSALFFDIDHFRDFNNRYSHATGNHILREVTQLVRASTRAVDIVARYGGDEFVILMPEVDANQAYSIAERIRQSIEAAQFQTKMGEVRVTISIGVAQLSADMVLLEELLEEANEAERQAKNAGRNQVITALDALQEAR